MSSLARLAGCAAGALLVATGSSARAVDIPDVGGETLTLDISNTTELAYHFDNRNDTPIDAATQSLNPTQYVDDRYGEWLNRLYLRAFYWRFSLGIRLDSAVYMGTMSRQDAQDLIVDKLGAPDLALENRFGRELHSRYAPVVYPAKLWLGYSQPGLEATVGDFYAQLGRGLVFSVRKMDELAVDTTVRGGRLSADHSFGDVKVAGTVFGGQMNPIRIDLPTGRILTGSGSPMFFLFPEARDYEYYADPSDPQPTIDRATPGYLEDNVIGAHLEAGTSDFVVGLNGAMLFRQSNSAEQLRCLQIEGRPADQCASEYPSFSSPEASRAHDHIRNISGSLRIPPIADSLDAYVEVAGQQMVDGRVFGLDAEGEPAEREPDRSGYAVYANVNVNSGPFTLTFEGKHYESFFALGANINTTTPGFSAPEMGVVTYSQPPTAESIYTEPIGSPDVCNTGARSRIDVRASEHALLYGWVGRYLSYSEIDPTNHECLREPHLRTATWDAAVGTELDADEGSSHAWAWVGARFADRSVPTVANAALPLPTAVFYREAYLRYDLNLHLTGPFSLSSLGFHRRRYEPVAHVSPWHEGENTLSLHWNPHWAASFGYEYQTLEGFPTHYVNGGLQYRSKSNETVLDQITDSVRLYVGQRRAAVRCVGGTCRLYPAFEGAQLELVSRF